MPQSWDAAAAKLRCLPASPIPLADKKTEPQKLGAAVPLAFPGPPPCPMALTGVANPTDLFEYHRSGRLALLASVDPQLSTFRLVLAHGATAQAADSRNPLVDLASFEFRAV